MCGIKQLKAQLARHDVRIVHFTGDKPWSSARRRSKGSYREDENLNRDGSGFTVDFLWLRNWQKLNNLVAKIGSAGATKALASLQPPALL